MTLTVLEPATEKVLAEIPRADEDAARAAVARAKAAYPGWRAVAPAERSRLLRRLADAIEARLDELAVLEARNAGKPIGDARGEMGMVVDTFRYYAGAPERTLGATIPVAGEVMSEGVVDVVAGPGATAGRDLVEHPDVAKVAFTGSTEVGRAIAAGAAATIKRVTLELGGKSANIVFADADVQAAATSAPGAVFGNAGEDCCARSRILVERPALDAYTEVKTVYYATGG
jgi:acyl-CoA reductase-like NAD-dependent aldehyde dehydrogenase